MTTLPKEAKEVHQLWGAVLTGFLFSYLQPCVQAQRATADINGILGTGYSLIKS